MATFLDLTPYNKQLTKQFNKVSDQITQHHRYNKQSLKGITGFKAAPTFDRSIANAMRIEKEALREPIERKVKAPRDKTTRQLMEEGFAKMFAEQNAKDALIDEINGLQGAEHEFVRNNRLAQLERYEKNPEMGKSFFNKVLNASELNPQAYNLPPPNEDFDPYANATAPPFSKYNDLDEQYDVEFVRRPKRKKNSDRNPSGKKSRRNPPNPPMPDLFVEGITGAASGSSGGKKKSKANKLPQFTPLEFDEALTGVPKKKEPKVGFAKVPPGPPPRAPKKKKSTDVAAAAAGSSGDGDRAAESVTEAAPPGGTKETKKGKKLVLLTKKVKAERAARAAEGASAAPGGTGSKVKVPVRERVSARERVPVREKVPVRERRSRRPATGSGEGAPRERGRSTTRKRIPTVGRPPTVSRRKKSKR